MESEVFVGKLEILVDNLEPLSKAKIPIGFVGIPTIHFLSKLLYFRLFYSKMNLTSFRGKELQETEKFLHETSASIFHC